MKVCRVCKTEKSLEDFGKHKTTKDRLQTACKLCMNLATKLWTQKNSIQRRQVIATWKKANKVAVNISNYKRRKRLNIPLWDTEFTSFVTEEAHHLRGLRDLLTGFKWHVDHIIPLKGKFVSGLHVWNNLAVIPAQDNLKKLNKYE